jgi:archaellum component FlaF (FlaF/FlaG flagellin family)
MNKRSILVLVISLVLFGILLVGCESQDDGATQAIQAYIQALSDKDINQVSILSCKDWEQTAITEVDSLTSVGSKVEDLQCKESGKNGNDILVSCTGNLVLDYNGEAQTLDLSLRTYIARNEDGEWRMCGYQQ